MSFPRHIAVLNVFFAPNSYGGATVVAEEVAFALAEKYGVKMTAISVMSRPELAPYTVMRTEKRGITSNLINLPKSRSYTEIYDNPRIVEIVLSLLNRAEPDLVHAHSLQDVGASVIPAAKAYGLPVVLSVHDFWWICERQFMIRPDRRYCGQDPVRIEACRGCVTDWPRAKARHDALLAMAGQAELITFPSQFARDLSKRSGMTAPRMAVWENGTRPPEPGFFSAQTARRAHDPRLVFGYLGGPSPIKGWPLIKAAFETLNREDFAGILVDGSLDGSWWRPRDIARLKGDWRIQPRFSQEEMDGFYAQIDVLLFPSQWKETFGLAIREARARGIAVLQTDGGGSSEWPSARPLDMLRIGDGPEVLRARVTELIESGRPAPTPEPLVSHADQANAFLSLIAPLAPVGPK